MQDAQAAPRLSINRHRPLADSYEKSLRQSRQCSCREGWQPLEGKGVGQAPRPPTSRHVAALPTVKRPLFAVRRDVAPFPHRQRNGATCWGRGFEYRASTGWPSFKTARAPLSSSRTLGNGNGGAGHLTGTSRAAPSQAEPAPVQRYGGGPVPPLRVPGMTSTPFMGRRDQATFYATSATG